tara:strand:- start:6637 stop:6900 length:264 start_codon:yes stop_codon:yes gene_type:complete
MSEFVHQPGRGSIFKNDSKQGKQPDYTGKGKDIEGRDIEIAAWVATSEKGNKYLSIKMQYPKTEEDKVPKKAPEPKIEEPEDPDLPF